MAYSTLGWQNGQEPAINAENLNHMDQGIADADAAATAAATIAGQASAAVDGKVSKQTTTSTAKRVYAYDNTGDTNVVISADNDNGGTIVQRTSAGRIVCNDPNAAGQAATKGYVDDRVQANPTDAATADLTKLKVGDTTYGIPKGYSTISPSLTTYQNINGYTWSDLYSAMQAADAANSPLYLLNADRWLHFGTNPVDTICNQVVTFAFDEILGNKFFFVLKYVKEQSGTQTIQEIQCSITSTGVISAA